MPMQVLQNKCEFYGCKNDNFDMKNFDIFSARFDRMLVRIRHLIEAVLENNKCFSKNIKTICFVRCFVLMYNFPYISIEASTRG